MTDYRYEELADMAFEMVQEIDSDIHEAEINGDGPTEKFFNILKSAITVYNHYADLANDCEECEFRHIKYVENRGEEKMINPSMTDKQNEVMFATKRQMWEDVVTRLNNEWELLGRPTENDEEADKELYIAMNMVNYYSQVLNEDYDCEYTFYGVLEDAKWEPYYKELLKNLEGVEDAK